MEKEREKSHFFERISFYEVPLKTLLLYHVAVGSGGGPRLEQEVPEGRRRRRVVGGFKGKTVSQSKKETQEQGWGEKTRIMVVLRQDAREAPLEVDHLLDLGLQLQVLLLVGGNILLPLVHVCRALLQGLLEHLDLLVGGP